MNELTIEEKAKCYDEAIERARDVYTYYCDDREQLRKIESIFPELKESEDEKIRSALLRGFNSMYANQAIPTFAGEPIIDILAWLEKQGRHANFRNKIQVGDKVTRNEDGVLVNLSQLKRIAKKDEKHGEKEKFIKKELGYIKGYRELAIKRLNEIEKQGEQKPVDIRTIGYWHVEDVEQKAAEKPVWYDNMDDLIADGMIDEIQKSDLPKGSKHNRIYWINKHRVQPQPKQEWNEEDKRKLNRIYSILGQAADTHAFSTTCRLIGDKECVELQDFLKSLKDRVQPQNSIITDEELAQAKNDAYNNVLDKIEYDSENPTFDDGWSAAIWYLKKRNAQPQNTWKPSESDIRILEQVIDGTANPCNYQATLHAILEKLKKLREKLL